MCLASALITFPYRVRTVHGRTPWISGLNCAISIHFSFHQLDLSLSDRQGTLRNFAPVQLEQIFSEFKWWDNEELKSAARCLEAMQIHGPLILVQRPFDFVADFRFRLCGARETPEKAPERPEFAPGREVAYVFETQQRFRRK
jgi:hypothetical protein